jgi:hypothetical protein
MFNQAVKICISPHVTNSPGYLITKTECFTFFERYFRGKYIIFFFYFSLCTRQIHNVPPCYLVLCVATLVVIKAEKPDCLIEFTTWTWYIYFASRPTYWRSGTPKMNLPNTSVSARLLGLPRLFFLHMRPVYTCFSKSFLIELKRG